MKYDLILEITNTKDQCFSLQFKYYIQLNPFIEKPEGNEIRKNLRILKK